MKKVFFFLLALATLLPCAASEHDHNVTVANDPAILQGTLPSGLTYYIYRCLRPAYRTNFYLINNIGSTVETDTERGMAHFTEHMAFNGSRHFPGRSIVSTLERHGLEFGYDINAFTTHDATVYNISNIDALEGDQLTDTCLLMLKDIACGLTLADADIESERRVIMEEWRQGNDATQRISGKMLSLLFGHDHPYGCRMPIGIPEVISTFRPEDLRRFYTTWYQPQHQAIVVIGYINPPDVEKAIRRIFKDMKKPAHPSLRVWPQVADNTGITGGVITDPEFGGCQIDMWFKIPIPPRDMRDRLSYIFDSYTATIAYIILQSRMTDVPDEPGSPWSFGLADYSQYYLADSKDGFRLACIYDRNRRDSALIRLVSEAKRAALYGVTDDEMQMATDAMRTIARSRATDIDEKNNDEQFERISEHFLKRNPVFQPDEEARIILEFTDTITAATINTFLRRWLTPKNTTIVMVEKAPDRDSSPSDSSFLHAVDSLWSHLSPEPPAVDTLYRRPLIPHLPAPGRVVSAVGDSIFPARHYTFENGARVTVCRSSVLADQADIRAVRRGGQSALLDSGYVDGLFAPDLADLGGLGQFSQAELRKKFTHTHVNLETRHTPYAELIEGLSELNQIEPLLQLMHLRLTGVRSDSLLYSNWAKNMRATILDNADDPVTIFSDSIRVALYGHNHPYLRTIVAADIDTLSYSHALRLFSSRIANPVDFDFIITGNFEPDSIVPLLEKYIGSLPGQPSRREPHHRIDRLALDGHREISFTLPMSSPVSKAYLAWEIHRPYTITDEMTLSVLESILEKRLLQSLRTESGATYTPIIGSASGEVDGFHSLFISFDTNADMLEQMVDSARTQLQRIASDGIDDDTFVAVRDYLLENEYVSTMQQSYPMEYFTHLALYANSHRSERVPALSFITPDQVQALARDFINAPASVIVKMTGIPMQHSPL